MPSVAHLEDLFAINLTSGFWVRAREKMQVPGVGWLAYVKDPEGNIFGMLQPEAQ